MLLSFTRDSLCKEKPNDEEESNPEKDPGDKYVFRLLLVNVCHRVIEGKEEKVTG